MLNLNPSGSWSSWKLKVQIYRVSLKGKLEGLGEGSLLEGLKLAF